MARGHRSVGLGLGPLRVPMWVSWPQTELHLEPQKSLLCPVPGLGAQRGQADREVREREEALWSEFSILPEGSWSLPLA